VPSTAEAPKLTKAAPSSTPAGSFSSQRQGAPSACDPRLHAQAVHLGRQPFSFATHPDELTLAVLGRLRFADTTAAYAMTQPPTAVRAEAPAVNQVPSTWRYPTGRWPPPPWRQAITSVGAKIPTSTRPAMYPSARPSPVASDQITASPTTAATTARAM
jgi:hypothetical protein